MIYTIFIIAFLIFTDSKLKLSDGFLILGLYIMTILSRRQIYLLIFLASIPVVKLINDFIIKDEEIDKINTTENKFYNILFGILAICVLGISIYNYILKFDKEYINSEYYPVKASKWIKDNLDLENMRLYNDYNFGSYLLWQGIPVFIDSRCDLYTPEFNKGVVVFDDYMEVKNGKRNYKELFEKYNINYAIIYKTSIENTYLKDDEKAINLYEDEYFVIYKYDK